jgi:hypothetical protein
MTRQQKIMSSLLLLGGTIFIFLINWPLFSYVNSLLNEWSLSANKASFVWSKTYIKIHSAIWQLLVFWFILLFNYHGKNKKLFNRLSSKYQIIFWIGANIILFIGLSMVEQLSLSWFLLDSDLNLSFPTDILITNMISALGGIMAGNFFILLHKLNQEKAKKVRLEEERNLAMLQTLKNQINPHFFFNTLSSLSSVVRNDKKENVLKFIQEISNTFRYSLSNTGKDLVTLKEEMEFVHSYLFIMKKRLEGKLIITVDITDKNYYKNVPNMAVQLLVENAISHNIITQTTPLIIDIFNDEQFLSVKNNLNPKQHTEGIGIGLSNLKDRYHLLAEKEIVIEKNTDSFTVKLPLL